MRKISPTGLTGDNLLAYYRTALNTKDELLETPADEDVILDLRDADWLNPAFLAPISVVYHQLLDQNSKMWVWRPDDRIKSYLDHIGFPSGDLNPDTSSSNSLPLYLMESETDTKSPSKVATKIRTLIKKHLYNELGGKINSFQYPIGEIVSNIETHSKYSYATLLSQYYPNKGCLDICIVDDGISIPGNFEDHSISFDDDYDALKKAFTERLSTRPDDERQQGYGLFTSTNMICEGLNGQVVLSSRNATMNRMGSSMNQTLFNYNWSGTVFAARLNTPSPDFNYLDYV
ncbi:MULTISPECIES: hypothetical protein [unclassified Haloferax]|uniref:hypothetical protein n=1 Tax=unclassified Haloferax TaxID=2625095 RepID=UPI0011C052BC|nr:MULTISPECIES: hypothetical protein [unclassified Haloferax]